MNRHCETHDLLASRPPVPLTLTGSCGTAVELVDAESPGQVLVRLSPGSSSPLLTLYAETVERWWSALTRARKVPAGEVGLRPVTGWVITVPDGTTVTLIGGDVDRLAGWLGDRVRSRVCETNGERHG